MLNYNIDNSENEDDEFCEALIQGTKPPLGFYRKSKNRIMVIRYLVEVVLERTDNQRLSPLKVDDFKNNHLYGLLTTYYNCSPRKAIQEAYKEELQILDVFNDPEVVLQKLLSHEISEPPRGFWTTLENRQLTTQYFVKNILQREHTQIYDISAKDFVEHGLGGFIAHYYQCSPNRAILEAFIEAKSFLFKRIDASIWSDSKTRQEAVKYFVSQVPSNIKITSKLLISLGMKHSLIKYYNSDIKKLLNDY